jgi:photosystem II stability/assembly factor-like uncharacterized protein
MDSLVKALHWRNVGPDFGGRVTTVAGIPDKPHVFYAGFAGSGVWKTTNAGYSWKNISSEDFKTDAIGAMAVAPSNPKIIYVGAGDSAPRNTVLAAGGGDGGMYKSTDGGKSWKQIGLEKTNIINWIVVNPNNPEVVYVAAFGHLFGPNKERGVYKTTDGGKTWKKVLYVNDETGANMLAMDPDNPQVLYATMWQMKRRAWNFISGGKGSGIYKTTDGGAHWKNITHNQGLPSGIFGKVGVAVSPSKPNVVYVLIQANYKPAHPGGLFRSEDGGKTWKIMNDDPNITQRAFYYMRVYVDPKDANTVYLPNVGVYVSHDAGKTLKSLRPPHGDNHAFWINPKNPQIFVEGNDGGATVTLNGGRTFSSESNQPTGQFYSVTLDKQFPFHIYGSQQDRGSVEGASRASGRRFGSISWHNVVGGEESQIAPEPGNPGSTIGQSYFGRFYRGNHLIGISRAISPWPTYKFGSGGKQVKYRYGWIHGPITYAPNDAGMLLVGANVVFESHDQGTHWQKISPDLTRNDTTKQIRGGGPISKDVTSEEMYDTISSISISSISPSIIWVGSDDGLVHVTTDGGEHWNAVRPDGLPKWIVISSIEASHTNPGAAWLTASHYMWDDYQPYVYKTSDYGKHWTKITAGLPKNQYSQSIAQDPDDSSLVFLGTSNAVYFSMNGGSQWKTLSLNLPPVRVTDIAIQPEQHAVAISTFGRAFWVLDNLQYLEQLDSAQVASDGTYLFKPQDTWLTNRARGYGADVFFHLPANYSGDSVKVSFTTADGKLINSIMLPKKSSGRRFFGGNIKPAFGNSKKKAPKLQPGMNHFQWNMRYPTATTIDSIYHSPFGVEPTQGPRVMPGTYYVQLSYDGHTTQKRPFKVKLDPYAKATTTRPQLQQRFNLLKHVHNSIDNLDVSINKAIAVRSQLQKAVADGKVSKSDAEQAIDALNEDINSVVNFKIQSGEGGLVFRPQLRSWLGSFMRRTGMGLVAPTASQKQVGSMYIGQQQKASSQMAIDIGKAKSLLKR